MQFEEDNIRPSDEDPEFTGGALTDHDTDIDDEFLGDDLPLVDDDLLADDEDDDESDLPTADL